MGLFGSIKEKVTNYIDINVRLVKLNMISHTSRILSYFMFVLIALFITFCMLLFSGFVLTEVFVTAGLSRLASLFVTIGVYAILLAIVVAFRRRIARFFASGIIDVITEGDEDEKDVVE